MVTAMIASREFAVEQEFRIRTRPAHPATRRLARGTLQLHQQPVFSRQACLCGSFFEFADWLSCDACHDDVAWASAARDHHHVGRPSGNVCGSN